MNAFTALKISFASSSAKLFSERALFGSSISDKFPNAVEDVEEAGKCLALDRSTACVFHLMRIMEIGVQQLARKMKVAVNVRDSWGDILRNLQAPIQAMPQRMRPEQYQHIARQVKEIAREQDPTHSSTASIDAIEDFHELRDTGGILGGLNVRVFFFLDKRYSAIVILGVIKKQNNGPTPKPDRIRMRRRKRKYLNGDYGDPEELI